MRWKVFWSSVWKDAKSLIVGHWLRLVGFVIAYLGPFAFFISAYATVGCKKEYWSFSFPYWVWIVIIPLLAVYWLKAKKSIELKVAMMKTENEIDSARHYGTIVLCEILKVAMQLATMLIILWVVKASEDVLGSASIGIGAIAAFYAIGGFLFILDAVFTRAPKNTDIKIK